MSDKTNMGRLRIVALLILVVFSVSCTRDVPEKISLSLSVPPVLSVQNTQPLRLGLVVINMRTQSGELSVVKFNDQDLGFLQPGGNLNLVIPGFRVPRDPQLLVQYFGVFQSEDAGMLFSYGSTTVNSDTNGPIPANIVATNYGSATRRANFYGRYDFGGDDFRNGTVVMEFINTGADPYVEIEASDMINGYLDVTAVDSAGAVRHVFYNDDGSPGVPIFGGDTSVTLLSTTATDAQLAQIDLPIRTKKEIGGFDATNFNPKLNPPQDVFVGFFGSTGKCVEYPAAGEDVYLSGTYTPDFTTPIQFKGTGGTIGTNVMVTTGGQTTPCGGSANITDFKINPRWTSEDNVAPHGIEAPFVSLSNYTEEPVFARATVAGDPNPIMTLKWNYIPGLTTAHVLATTVYYKYDPYNNDGGGGDKDAPCNIALESQGYEILTNVAGAGPNLTHVVSSLPGVPALSYDYMDPNFYRNFKFALCPKRDVAGTHVSYGMYAEIHDPGEMREVNELGYGNGLDLGSGIGSQQTFAPWGERVSAVTSITDYTQVALFTTAQVPNVGDEVFIYVVGRSGPGACGYRNGYNDTMYEIRPGDYHYARVHATSQGATDVIDILDGSWVQHLVNLGGAPGATFCRVQAIHVPNYSNIIFLTNGSLTPNAFDYGSNNVGGLMLMRVAESVSLGGTPTGGSFFNADGKGFLGATTVNLPGSGELGDGTSGNTGNGGFGFSAQSGGGGGGAEAGGDGAGHVGSGGMGANLNQDPHPVYLLGGGGAVGDGGTGGNGGGLISVAARQMDFQGFNVVATSNGMPGTGASLEGNGGGGGGAVNIITERMTRTATEQFHIYANGGAGSTASTNGGGGGGGGAIRLNACDFWNEPGNPIANRQFQGNGGAGGAAATNGMGGIAANPLGLFHPGPGCVPDP